MKKNKSIVNKNPKELAVSLGLSPLDAIEWQIRHIITQKIIDSAKKNKMTVTDIAKKAGTSRARISKILKSDNQGISLDILIRILAVLGNEIKISFKKAA